MKISIVVTVKNDKKGVEKLLKALSIQTKKPNEVIIIRAEDHGNCSRAEGRNLGIKKAKNDIIAVTDVGCRPQREWLERLTNPLKQLTEGSDLPERSDPLPPVVIAGFYRVVTKTPLQQAIAPYLAVFPDQWNERYLPASRSIAFTRRVWELVGGYPEEARSGAEDLLFAARLAKHPNITMLHAPDALVDWEPPKTFAVFFRDIVKHTRGNREARYWPHLVKNYSVLFRWLVFLLIPWLIPVYLMWPIVKHRRRVGVQGLFLLPVIQLLSDVAVIYALLR